MADSRGELSANQRRRAAILQRLSKPLPKPSSSSSSSPSSPFFESVDSFLSNFSLSKLSIQSRLDTCQSKEDLDQILSSVADLERVISENSYFLPSYEVQTALKTVANLKDLHFKTTHFLFPRKKFSFKNKYNSKKPLISSPESEIVDFEQECILEKDFRRENVKEGEREGEFSKKPLFSPPESQIFDFKQECILEKDFSRVNVKEEEKPTSKKPLIPSQESQTIDFNQECIREKDFSRVNVKEEEKPTSEKPLIPSPESQTIDLNQECIREKEFRRDNVRKEEKLTSEKPLIPSQESQTIDFNQECIVGKNFRRDNIKEKENPNSESQTIHFNPIISSSGFRNKQQCILVKDFRREHREEGEFSLCDLSSCDVYIRGKFRALFVHNLKNCRVFAGPVINSVLVEEVEGCILMIASHQVRIHHSIGTDFYLRVRSHPIVEDCSGVRFAPFRMRYEGIEDELGECGLSQENGNWALVDDFRWLRATQSPNWRVLPEEERLDCVDITDFDEFGPKTV